MSYITPTNKLSGLARTLIKDELLSDADALAIQEKANQANTSFISELIASQKLSAKVIAEASASAFGFPYLDIDAFDTEYLPTKQIDPELMLNHHVMVLKVRSNIFFVAISDPTNLHTLDTIQFQMGMTLMPIVVEDDKLIKLIKKVTESVEDQISANLNEQDFDIATAEIDEEAESAKAEVDDAPIVKFINKMLLDAINMGASDLHFEPYEKFYRIRYRIDGVLRDVAQPPLAIKDKLASRVKVISNLDISEKRIPQDGRMKLKLSKTRTIDFRVSTLPLIH